MNGDRQPESGMVKRGYKFPANGQPARLPDGGRWCWSRAGGYMLIFWWYYTSIDDWDFWIEGGVREKP